MARPGLTVETGPAIRCVERKLADLKTSGNLLHQVPAAEYVALVAIHATLLAEACMNVCESIGLNMADLTRLQCDDPQEFQQRVVALIREK